MTDPIPAPEADVAQAPAATTEHPALDAGTYDGILEPRSPNRLTVGDGAWHQLSPRFVVVEQIQNTIFAVIAAAVALVLWLALGQLWAALVGAAVLAVTAVVMFITPRQARARGYRLRDDDLVYRSGIMWQRVVAVPYGRMQLVDISHGPLDRAFGIARLKLVTAAAGTSVVLQGLSQDAAEQLRDVLIEVAETRRTGL